MRSLIVAAAALVAVLAAGPASAATAPAAAPAAGDTWPMFGHDPLHSEVSADTTIGASAVAPNAAGGRDKPLSNPTLWKLIADEQIGPVTATPDIVPGPISSTSSGSSFTNTWKAAN